jgi:hypothetical protein
MNRRIREVLAVRRTLAADPRPPAEAEPDQPKTPSELTSG